MLRVLIRLQDCKAGDILAQDIFSANGALIVPRNTPINSYIINKLSFMGIEQIYVNPGLLEDSETKDARNSSYRRFFTDYKKNLNTIREIIINLSSNNGYDLESINRLIDSLIKYTNEVSDVLKCLNDIKSTSEYVYCHSLNVAMYTMLISKWLGFSDTETKDIMKAGLLHDIGKANTPIDILNKPDKLTPAEYEVIKKHPVDGYMMAKGAEGITDDILQGILLHHEKHDGSGYPLKVNFKQIGAFPKIVAIADVYDALNTDRVYRKRVTPFDAFKVLEKDGIGHFDISMLRTFVQNIAYFYVGYEILTNTGERGKILNVVPHSCYSPIISVKGRIIDLSVNKDIYIAEMLS